MYICMWLNKPFMHHTFTKIHRTMKLHFSKFNWGYLSCHNNLHKTNLSAPHFYLKGYLHCYKRYSPQPHTKNSLSSYLSTTYQSCEQFKTRWPYFVLTCHFPTNKMSFLNGLYLLRYRIGWIIESLCNAIHVPVHVHVAPLQFR